MHYSDLDEDPYGGDFHGDYYRESSTVTRGTVVSLLPSSDGYGEGFSPYSYGFLEADDVLKGAGLAYGGVEGKSGIPESSQASKSGFQSGSYFDQDPHTNHHDPPFAIERGQASGGETGHKSFSEVNILPKVPSDSYYVFALTMFKMKLPPTGLPHNIGNDFLSFLTNKVKSTVLKVREVKGWVSANVYLDDETCRLKARFYQEPEQLYSLELRRCNGGTLPFNKVYKMLVSSFQDCGYDVLMGEPPSFGTDLAGDDGHLAGSLFEPSPWPPVLDTSDGFFSVPPMPPPLGFGDPAVEESYVPDIAPIVDTMLLTELPSIQIEGFNALGGIAVEQPHLFNDGNFIQKVKELLTSSFPESEHGKFAFARMLSQVTRGAEATQALSENGILPLVAARLYNENVPSIIKQELAQALAEAAKNLSSSTAKDKGAWINDLKVSLTGVLKDQKVQDSVQKAQAVMKSGSA